MNLNNKKTTGFDYSNYLSNYYNRLASGKEKLPSDAELSLFIRQLGNLSSFSSSQNTAEDVESVDEVTFKMTA